MRIALKIMAFTLSINFALGLLVLLIPEFVALGATGDLNYDPTMTGEFTNNINGSINPSGVLEDRGNAIYRLLDTINLGFIAKFLNVVEDLIYGFANIMSDLFKEKMSIDNPTLANFIFGDGFNPGMIRVIITIVYTLTAISFWTGKDLDD